MHHGIYEIPPPLPPTFVQVNTPLGQIIFHYNPSRKKYIPELSTVFGSKRARYNTLHLASWEIWIDCVALKVINSQMPKLRTCLQTPGITLDKHFMLNRPNEYCCSAFMSHFISALLSLASCANFAPSKGHVSRHSSLKQECVTSISLTSQFTARFLPATGCGLTTRKDYCSSPSVARLITGEA